MHLNRLEINGFKSFGEKVVLEFAPGVTGIVGPNGSGKSNIVDAIRWVLGEQGYKGIRLERSDDVIFLGSKGKGKMSRASVEMLLCDIPQEKGFGWQELSVARHVYRDGEGEYFMNKSQVRLKDIHGALAQLHVSTKNYSIVTQGMSDQLLRFSPQELRSTLEDASGVKGWQLKKREAERKLARSDEHTAQVQALLAELKPYLNNLRNQMRRWEKRDECARKAQELKELHIYVRAQALASTQRDVIVKKQDLQERIRAHEQEKERLAREIAEAEKFFGAGRSLPDTEDRGLAELYEKRMALERDLIKAESQLAALKGARDKNTFDAAFALQKVSRARHLLEGVRSSSSPEALKAGIMDAIAELVSIEALFTDGGVTVPKEIAEAQAGIKKAIAEVERELDARKHDERKAHTEEQQRKESLFQKERALRRVEDELGRALENEAALMETFDRLSREEQQLVGEARAAVPDSPATLQGLCTVLEASHGGKLLPTLEKIGEELIRANVYLSDIGDLDPNIKAEHDKVEERFGFLTKELEDVRQAKDDLQKLALDLEAEIQKKFEDSFSEVNVEFGKYMETIFGGGKGELVKLIPPKRIKHDDDDGGEEEEEQEKEGVVVRVELPGKRIKSMELLSGGERALTSLAFLFALISTAKPPFVVLDEVDAALDEENSRRFAELLESVKNQTQCIVVTHNRSTMAAASSLYGITMGGDGVSRILSLKLES